MTRQNLRAAQDLESRIRASALLACVVGFVVGIWGIISVHGYTQVIFIVLFAAVVLVVAARFLRERSMASRHDAAVGIVVDSERSASSDGGYDYWARYEFNLDGHAYFGESKAASDKLPERGGAIIILYEPGNPSRNLPIEMFWFYRFSLKGVSLTD
jgi:Protein of unknown function (DUF3592)